MTPKEKAEELIIKFSPLMTTWNCYWDTPRDENDIREDAKKFALILVEEVIKNIPMYTGNLNPKWKFWNEVKEELTKK